MSIVFFLTGNAGKNLNMVKDRGSRFLKVDSPSGSKLFNLPGQFDMA
jgi:hypothetical protein